MSAHNREPFSSSGLPGLYSENSDSFKDFVEAYYGWMDSGGSEISLLNERKDVDTTIDKFLESFRFQYLTGLPLDKGTPFLVKHIQDLYKAKGSDRGYKLLFRILFDEDIEVYKPNSDILRPSDGTWVIPRFIELSVSARAFTWPGKTITGTESGATAFVDSVVRKRVAGRFFDVVYLKDIKGEFSSGETVTENGILLDAPTVIGALNEIEISNGGQDAETGDLYLLQSNTAIGGKAVVRAVENATGKMAFSLVDGGWGYSNTPIVTVGSDLLYASSSNTFLRGELLVQPQNRLSLTSANGSINIGDIVTRDGGNTGKVLSVNSTVLVLAPTNGSRWYKVSNVSTNTWSASVTLTTDVSARGIINGSNNTALGVSKNSGNFYSYGTIKTEHRVPLGIATSANTSTVLTGNNTVWSSTAVPGDLVLLRSNNFVLGTVNTVTNNISLTLTSNSLISYSGTGLWFSREQPSTSNVTSVYNIGSGASFQIGERSNTISVQVCSDVLSSNNSGGIPFLDILLSGTNSNLASNAYGFSGNTALGKLGKLGQTLGFVEKNIGEIKTLSRVNQGSGYTSGRFVSVDEPLVSSYNKNEIVFTSSNTTGFLSVGSYVDQNQTLSRSVLSVANTAGFVLSEGISGNNGARGILRQSNSTTLTVDVVNEISFTTGSLTGTYSNTSSTISSVASADQTITVSGKIRAISNTGQVYVRRTSFQRNFQDGEFNCIAANGVSIGSGWMLIDWNSPPMDETMGLNAEVSSTVAGANGIITRLEVIDSGHGYLPGSEIVLLKEDGTESSVTGTAVVRTQGKESGYWTTDSGKLNMQKIHDNKYYQDFSYEIQASVSLDVYADILKQAMHISGLELFGRTVIQTESGIQLSSETIHES